MNYIVCFGSSLQIMSQVHEVSSYLELIKSPNRYHLIIVGMTHETLAFSERITGVTFVKTNPYLFDLSLLENQIHKDEVQEILFASGNYPAMYATKIGYRLNCFVENGVIAHSHQEGIIQKYVYSNNLVQTQTVLGPLCLSIAKGFNEVYATHTLSYESIEYEPSRLQKSHHHTLVTTDAQVSLADAKYVCILGKGMMSQANCDHARLLAKSLDFEVGATRPVCYQAWSSMSSLIGVSGTLLSSDLVLCLGVRGASALTYGIKKAKTVIAINRDIDAPIFKHCDVGLVMDTQTFLIELDKIVKSGDYSE